MTSLDLYGARTGNTLRAALALAESGLPFRAVAVDLARGEHKAPAFKALNPLSKVPVLVLDDGDGPWALSQSGAIMLEVARRCGTRLLPDSPRQRALALERFFYFITDVIGPSHAGFFLAGQAESESARILDALVFERIGVGANFVSRASWMGGGQFSLADIAAFSLVASVHGQLDWSKLPALAAWFERVATRPAIRLGMSSF